MKNLKLILFTLSCFLFYKDSIAQDPQTITMSYTYDNSGNRTHRNIQITPLSQLWMPNQSDTTTESSTDSTTNQSSNIPKNNESLGQYIKPNVYPNPTQDMVTVDFVNTSSTLEPKSHHLILMDAKNATCFEKSGKQLKESIDLSKFASGQYLLIIRIDNKQFVYNIQKIN